MIQSISPAHTVQELRKPAKTETKPPPDPMPLPESAGHDEFDDPRYELYGNPAPSVVFDQSLTGRETIGATSSGPECNAAAFTRRLVAASMQFVVNNIIGEAFSALVNLRVASAQVPEEEKGAYDAAIRRLDVLVNRAFRKLEDLNKEDDLRLKQHQAEKRRDAMRAEAIKEELRRRLRERQERERGYLTDDGVPLDAGTEAVIEAEARMLASVYAGGAVQAAAEAGGDMGTISVTVSAEGTIAAGGEAPAAEGAAAS